ncbi:MAG: tetratricopeptide repeat protein [Syntrophobacteraceae bacterium]|nr:tetratricopeptide repeat protein [Syntrophobacteraceae bacterium]
MGKTETQSLENKLEKVRKACAALSPDDPASSRALTLQGLLEFQMGHEEEAQATMERAVRLKPDSVDAAYGLATLHLARKRYGQALAMMRRVIALKPDHGKAYHGIARILKDRGDPAGALDALKEALKINPQDIDVLTDLGNTLKELNRLPEASLCHEQALRLAPENHKVLNNLGVVRFLGYDPEGAETFYRAALAVRPDFPEALSNLATIRRLQGDLDTSISCCQKALALRPDYPEAFNNLGNALKDGGRPGDAVAAYEKAVGLKPEDGDFHMNLGMALLGLGRFEKGWREYRWRWKSPQLSRSFPAFEKPEWEGEPGDGRVILVHAEQGFGDTLQFCRYAPLIRERGFHVIMRVQRPLARLIESLRGVEKVISEDAPPTDFDLHCPMMSLPFALRTTLETIPAELPYLSADPADVQMWRDRLGALPGGELRVGLVWAGSSRSRSPDLIATDRARSLSPEKLASLLGVEGVRFFSLQKDGARAPDDFHLADWMERCKDFADTAALIMNLDLVIGVDTAVAHLAGALGRPFWLLNRFTSCWRWLAGRNDSPWYPGALRIFRQKQRGDWDEVISRVRKALAEKASQEHPR